MPPAVSQIPALTGVRILAAAWVVVAHFRFEMFGLFPSTQFARSFVEGGYLGVEVFFILSGFIISHNYAGRFGRVSWSAYRDFLMKRVARIYPVHLVTLLVVAGLVTAAALFGVTLNSEGAHNPLNFLMNATMLQAVPPAFAWNAPAWSISAEMGAYIAFPFLAVAVMRVKSRNTLLLLTAGALAFTIMGLLIVEQLGDYSPTSYASIWFRISGEFAAGCFLWRFWQEFTTPGRLFDVLAVVGAVGMCVMLLLQEGSTASDFLALPFIALLIIGCAGATGPSSDCSPRPRSCMVARFPTASTWSTTWC
jgi:peptidoglycan/LPS O-acetylase OafA/YrhL